MKRFLIAVYTIFAISLAAADLPYVNVKDYGAKGDGKTDDTIAIKKALESLNPKKQVQQVSGGIVFFPRGHYLVSDTISINHIGTTMLGEGYKSSIIRYVGTAFKNVIEINVRSSVRLKNLSFYGGYYTKGRAKYVVYAKAFNRNCEISGCQIREGVGLLYIKSGYYSNITDNQICNVTPSAERAGIKSSQWLQVHGPGNAPVVLNIMNTCKIDRNRFSNLGSQSGDMRTSCAIRVSGTAASFDTNSIEHLWPGWGENFDSSVNTVIRFDNFIGTVARLYMEGIKAHKNLIETYGTTKIKVSNSSLYRIFFNSLFYNDTVYPIKFSDSVLYRINGGSILARKKGSAGKGIYVDNVAIITGDRYTDTSIGNQTYNNLYDTRGSKYPLGMKDTRYELAAKDLFMERKQPRILLGYKLKTGHDKFGPYVQYKAKGIFVREDQKQVSIFLERDGIPVIEPAKPALKTNKKVTATIRVRPDENKRFYRVFVGQAGQVFLEKYSSCPKVMTGNWIYQFQLNSKGEFVDAKYNKRLWK